MSKDKLILIYDKYSNLPQSIMTDNQKPIMFFESSLSREERLAYGKNIVQCVNSHDALVKQRDALLDALEEISKGEGPYSNDRLDHAENTIESMIQIAEAAIAQCKERSDG